MIRPLRPYIIDIEASGFGSNSYPIEVGLALELDQRYCTLIRPMDHWIHWDNEAESLHRIRRELLTRNGRQVIEVARELNHRLDGKVVYSDAWGVDNAWVVELYAAAGLDKTFTVSSLEMILTEPQIALWPATRDAVVSDLKLERHRASNDAWIIQETYVRTRAMTSCDDQPGENR